MLQDALGTSDADLEDATVLISFSQTESPLEARPLGGCYSDPESEDVAILKMKDGLPQGARALPLGSSGGTRGHDFSSFGYPAADDVDGVWGNGRISGDVRTEHGIQLLQLSDATELTRGFSGAPVWDHAKKCVVGMISSFLKPDNASRLRDTAFAVPSETIQSVYPELELFKGLDVFYESTVNNLKSVPDKIGGRVSFSRGDEIEPLDNSVANHRITFLAGPSGCGKTVLVKKWAESRLGWVPVIWWNAGRLNAPDFGFFEKKLGLRDSLSDAVRPVSARDAYLLIDCLDRQFRTEVFQNLGQVIRWLSLEAQTCPWRVIITTQVNETERLQRELLGTGIDLEMFYTVTMTEPSVEQLEPVWESFPALRRLMSRPELHRLLLNPKVLDLFATNIAIGRTPETSQWTGESDLINWFWDAAVRRGNSAHERDRFVKLLAEKQADYCMSDIPVDSFDTGEVAPARGLIQDWICRLAEEQYSFEHDLLGDWARQRILLGRRGDLLAFLHEKQLSPVWHRALRLFGLHLLEQESVESWHKVYADLSSDEEGGGVLGDLLLESAVFAADPHRILESIWDILRADDGLLLNRFLQRFSLAATLPNPLVIGMAQAFQFEGRAGPATWERLPIRPYWPPVVRFLHKHKNEVLAIAWKNVAKVCERWLSYGPSTHSSQRDAADLVLDLAEDGVAAKTTFWSSVDNEELEKLVFKAGLESYEAAPDRTLEFALTACGRRQPSGRILSKIEQLRSSAGSDACLRRHTPDWVELSQRFPLYDSGSETEAEFEPPAQWPDGPTRIVDETFTEACFTTDALQQIILARPDAAREIVLASLIESPAHRGYSADSHFLRDKLGLTQTDDHFHPPFYSRQPFLFFLNHRFSEGLQLIIRLVDFVTDRWAERDSRRWGQPSEITLDLPGGPKRFVGDKELFSWYRDFGRTPHAVVTSLMALEKWFYDRFDSDQSVSEAIEQILADAKSMAFLGLLCCVGKKDPRLLMGELQPLLAVPEFYFWDILQQAQVEGSQMIAWSYNQPEVLVRLAQQWHNMPHRRKLLGQIVFKLFVESDDVRSLFDGIRRLWEVRVREGRDGPDGSRFIEDLIGLFDPRKLTRETDSEGNEDVFSKGLGPVTPEYKAQQEDHAIKNALLTLPFRLWGLLKEEESLPEESLEDFWKALQSFSSLTAREDWDIRSFGPEHCMAGGAAVLLRHHRDWLRSRPDRETWCLSTILNLVLDPPAPPPFDGDVIFQEGRWQGFCANIVPFLLAENPESKELRKEVALLASERHYNTVRILFKSAAEQRVQLGDDFGRLQHLVMRSAVARWTNVPAELLIASEVEAKGRLNRIRRAVMRWVHRLLTRFGAIEPGIEAWTKREINRFVRASTPTQVPDWRTIQDAVNEDLQVADSSDDGYEPIGSPGIDLHMVMFAYSWLTDLQDATDEEERADRIHFLGQALSCSLEVIGGLLAVDRRFDDTNLEWYRWLFDRLARIIPAMREDEHPERFWQPIVELGVEGHYWVQLFLSSWFVGNPALVSSPHHFRVEWQRMIELAFELPGWSFDDTTRASDLEDNWCALMGFEGYLAKMWTENHRPIVDQMRDLYHRWARHHLTRRRCGEAFAVFLKQPAAEGLRLEAIRWLAEAVKKVGEWYFQETSVEESIVSFLDHCWTRHRQDLRRNREAFADLNRLLRLLADRQNETAIELLQRIASGY